jgi:hypothetical protein
VTEPCDQNAPESHQPRAGEQSFRHELLRDMSGGECLSLSDIDSIIQYDYRTEPLSTRQSRAITAIKSLLDDGLIVIGDPGFAGEPVESWQLPTGEALARLHERYVTHYDDFAKWDCAPGSSSHLKVME